MDLNYNETITRSKSKNFAVMFFLTTFVGFSL